MTSGFRTFTAGEVLTASNVQNYLMDQSVMTFAGSAARSSAIGTANFEEGMTSYLKDTDKLEVYNGTNWVGVAPTTTQGLTLINTTSFSGVASQSLATNTFTSTYENYKILITLSAADDGQVFFKLRASGTDSSAGYYWGAIGREAGGGVYNNYAANDGTGFFILNTDGATPDITSSEITLFNPQLARKTKYVANSTGAANAGTIIAFQNGGSHSATTAYDSITFYNATGGNISGKVSTYGFNL